MLRFIRNMPIFRRLFMAFALATVVPAIVIVFLGNNNISSVDIRGQAVRTSFDAQNAASQQQINLQRMNALLQTRHNQIFASLSNQIKDASLSAAGALISSDIFAREADFNQALTDYQNNYDLATSHNMSTVQNILMSDNPNTHISSDQQAALNKVINVDWPKYKGFQDQELKQLDAAQISHLPIDQTYSTAYQTLFNANTAFTDLKNNWQRVVDIAIEMGKTVTAVGP